MQGVEGKRGRQRRPGPREGDAAAGPSTRCLGELGGKPGLLPQTGRTPLVESESSSLPRVAETEQIEDGPRALGWHQWALGALPGTLAVIS